MIWVTWIKEAIRESKIVHTLQNGSVPGRAKGKGNQSAHAYSSRIKRLYCHEKIFVAKREDKLQYYSADVVARPMCK